MKTHRFHLISMVSIALFVALAVGASVEKVQTIADHDGILDFSFVKPGYVVKLQGSWEYQDNQLYNDQVEQPDISQNGQTGRQSPSVDLPHYFSHPAGDLKSYSGFATYRIHLENLDPRVDYGIFIQEESSAYRLRANGQVIANYGQVGRDSSAYKTGLNPRLAVFRPDLSGQAEIAIELANFDDPRGGFWSIPKIGQYEDVLALYVREQLVEMFLFTANITMSLIFLALYARSSQDRHILLLSVFSFMIGCRILLSGNRLIAFILPQLGRNLSMRILYGIGYLLLPVFVELLQTMFDSKPDRRLSLLNALLAALALLIVLLGSNELIMGYFEVYKYLVVLASAYTVFVLVKGIRLQQPGARMILLAISILIAGTLAELFLGVERLPYIVGFSTMAMIGLFEFVQIEKFHILQAKKEDLENEIVLDRLTGAYNRHFLEYRIDEMIRQAAALNQPLSQIMLDLDDFKLVNDSYGHETGDQVLKKTVEIIKKGIRSTDPLIRWGGEEFLILAPNTDLSGAQILAEKLLQTISETDFVPAGKVTASIGVTELLSSESAESWFNRTDMALYRAKSTGKNRVCV